MIKSKKIVPGLYEVTAMDRTFQIEDLYQAAGGDHDFRNDWQLYEMVAKTDWETGEKTEKDREWCNAFGSKRDAMAAIEGILRGED